MHSFHFAGVFAVYSCIIPAVGVLFIVCHNNIVFCYEIINIIYKPDAVLPIAFPKVFSMLFPY